MRIDTCREVRDYVSLAEIFSFSNLTWFLHLQFRQSENKKYFSIFVNCRDEERNEWICTATLDVILVSQDNEEQNLVSTSHNTFNPSVT